jgi:hypothetical protein
MFKLALAIVAHRKWRKGTLSTADYNKFHVALANGTNPQWGTVQQKTAQKVQDSGKGKVGSVNWTGILGFIEGIWPLIMSLIEKFIPVAPPASAKKHCPKKRGKPAGKKPGAKVKHCALILCCLFGLLGSNRIALAGNSVDSLALIASVAESTALADQPAAEATQADADATPAPADSTPAEKIEKSITGVRFSIVPMQPGMSLSTRLYRYGVYGGKTYGPEAIFAFQNDAIAWCAAKNAIEDEPVEKMEAKPAHPRGHGHAGGTGHGHHRKPVVTPPAPTPSQPEVIETPPAVVPGCCCQNCGCNPCRCGCSGNGNRRMARPHWHPGGLWHRMWNR